MPMLDSYDVKILTVLSEEGRISWSELAQRIGLSLTPTLRRVRALEASGHIAGYHAVVSEDRLGYPISVFISISLEKQTDEALASFEREVSTMPEVMSCYMMTGEADFLLRVIVPSLEGYQRLVSMLTRIPWVARITSGFAVKSVVQRVAPPLSC